MKLQPIVAMIEDLKLFKQVDGVLAFADLEEGMKRAPAAFVVPASEKASANSLTGGHDQKVAVTFSVVLALAAAARDKTRVRDDLHDLGTRVIDTLTGATHPDMSDEIDYAGGQLLALEGGHVWWRLNFNTGYHVRII